MLLKGKIALVTGGTAGIGKAIALEFARQGAHVAIFGTNAERAKLTIEEMQACKIDDSQKFCSEMVDVASKEAVDEAIKLITDSWGDIHILVNNAGITRDGLLMKMKEEAWDEVINVNLKSAFNTCQSVVRSMLKAKSGKIINISSVVGLSGNAGQTNYAASKAGMIGFTKSLALELASRGINVNCIAPGFIQTSMTDQLSEAQKQGLLTKIPMARFGTPEEIAKAAVFLASEHSNYITGQTLTVDGGMVM